MTNFSIFIFSFFKYWCLAYLTQKWISYSAFSVFELREQKAKVRGEEIFSFSLFNFYFC